MTHSSHQILPYQQIYFDNLKWNELYLMKLGHYSKKLFVKGIITCQITLRFILCRSTTNSSLENSNQTTKYKIFEKVFNNCWEY